MKYPRNLHIPGCLSAPGHDRWPMHISPEVTTKHANATAAGWAISRDLLPDDHQKAAPDGLESSTR